MTEVEVRVAVLETQLVHLTDKLDDTHKKVEEMHALLLQAKGARWVLLGAAGVVGFLTGAASKILSFPLPR